MIELLKDIPLETLECLNITSAVHHALETVCKRRSVHMSTLLTVRESEETVCEGCNRASIHKSTLSESWSIYVPSESLEQVWR